MRYVLICVLFLMSTTIFAAGNNGVLGFWFTKDNQSIVEIYKKGSEFLGKIIWLDEPNDKSGKPMTDSKNSDNKKKNNPLLFLTILKGFALSNESTLENGTVYDPKNGKTYSSIIKLKNGGLEVRGYIGFSLFGRSETWTRCSVIPETRG